jgi:inosine-uridine nucleoside N-ribohydrolase
MSATPIVIDTDPGIDDVVALALALRSPELRVIALTTSYGNAPLEATTRNARHLLDLLGRSDVPIHPGADRPFQRGLVTAPETHGESGVGYAPVPPVAPVAPHPEILIDVLADLDQPVTLVTLGPLTNLARAVALDRGLVRRRVVRHIGMFGNIRERGNTNRWADFNAWCDPEAADMVLRAGLDTVMVGLDVTRRLTFSRTAVERYAESTDDLTSWLAHALRFYVEFHRRQERLDGCVVNDVLPVAELVAPGVLTLAQLSLIVDLEESEHRGHTREAAEGAMTAVALAVKTDRVHDLLTRVFGRAPPEGEIGRR